MSFLKRLLSRQDSTPPARIRICIECGMPVGEHKQWCSILRGQEELKARGLLTDASS